MLPIIIAFARRHWMTIIPLFVLATTTLQLHQTRNELAAARTRSSTLSAQLDVAAITLKTQNLAIKTQLLASANVTSLANQNLAAAHARTKKAEARIANIRSRPTPPPTTECAASDALLNQAFIEQAH